MAVKSATTTTFDQRCDSIARSRRIIKKNVLSKKPNDSSTRANAIIAANVRPILDHPSARILSGPPQTPRQQTPVQTGWQRESTVELPVPLEKIPSAALAYCQTEDAGFVLKETLPIQREQA